MTKFIVKAEARDSLSYAALGSDCCYRFLPAKWEIFLPTVAKCLFIEGHLIFRVFLKNTAGSLKPLEVILAYIWCIGAI